MNGIARLGHKPCLGSISGTAMFRGRNAGGMPSLPVGDAPAWRWMLFACLALGMAAKAPSAAADTAAADGAATLHARYEQLNGALGNNQFGRPLYLESEESSTRLKGEVYARVDYPFTLVSSSLNSSAQWCEVLILHLNIKYCRPSSVAGKAGMTVRIGKKYDQPLDEAHRVDFAYQTAAAQPGYFEVQMNAEDGPLGTSDYRIALKAVPVSGRQTFLHMTYSYAYGTVGRIAMKGYLATIGRDKVGFTKVDEQGAYIGGVRGVVERNTMRYYLAIDAYLNSLAAPPAQQSERRMQTWFDATERYRRQLHEMDEETYITMKRAEYQRQKTAQ